VSEVWRKGYASRRKTASYPQKSTSPLLEDFSGVAGRMRIDLLTWVLTVKIIVEDQDISVISCLNPQYRRVSWQL